MSMANSRGGFPSGQNVASSRNFLDQVDTSFYVSGDEDEDEYRGSYDESDDLAQIVTAHRR